MAAGYKAGDKAYIVESNRIVRKCTVEWCARLEICLLLDLKMAVGSG